MATPVLTETSVGAWIAAQVRARLPPDADMGRLELAVEQATREWGLLSHKEQPLARSMIPKVLADRFYIGVFDWAGDEYEGTHERFIPQELFERVQKVLADRGRGRYHTKKQRQPLVFLGVVRCDECGASVTAERQKGHHFRRVGGVDAGPDRSLEAGEDGPRHRRGATVQGATR